MKIWPISRRVVHLYRGDMTALFALVRGDRLLEGQEVADFEREFAERTGAKHAVAVSSGRVGLGLLVRAFDIRPGSEVIVPAYEDLSVPAVLSELGLVPVYADIDPRTMCIAPAEVERRLSDRTALVVVAHIFGNPCDMEGVRKTLRGRKVRLIEDCAHAVGTTIDGKHVGTFGDAAFFSFHTTKPFTTLGGGMLLTPEKDIADRLRTSVDRFPLPERRALLKKTLTAFAMHALTRSTLFGLTVYPWLRINDWLEVDPLDTYDRTFRRLIDLGRPVRYTNLQAALGRQHLRQLDRAVTRKRANAAILDEILGDSIKRPTVADGHNAYFYVLFHPHPDRLRRRLLRSGIDCGRNLMRNCAAGSEQEEGVPATATVIETCLQIPIHETLSPEHVKRMAAIIASELEEMGT